MVRHRPQARMQCAQLRTTRRALEFLAQYHITKECAVYDDQKNKGRNWKGFGDPDREKARLGPEEVA